MSEEQTQSTKYEILWAPPPTPADPWPALRPASPAFVAELQAIVDSWQPDWQPDRPKPQPMNLASSSVRARVEGQATQFLQKASRVERARYWKDQNRNHTPKLRVTAAPVQDELKFWRRAPRQCFRCGELVRVAFAGKVNGKATFNLTNLDGEAHVCPHVSHLRSI